MVASGLALVLTGHLGLDGGLGNKSQIVFGLEASGALRALSTVAGLEMVTPRSLGFS